VKESPQAGSGNDLRTRPHRASGHLPVPPPSPESHRRGHARLQHSGGQDEMARTKRVSRLSNYVAPAVTLDRDRRRERRGPVRREAQVTVLSGLARDEQYNVVTRDASTAGSSFYLKSPLPIGTR